jgi:hypothetical protein
MDVEKAIALVSAAGIELTDRRRNAMNDGWTLSFSNGSVLQISDAGRMTFEGKSQDELAKILNPSAG